MCMSVLVKAIEILRRATFSKQIVTQDPKTRWAGTQGRSMDEAEGSGFVTDSWRFSIENPGTFATDIYGTSMLFFENCYDSQCLDQES